jgi:hypothetical protein
MRSSDSPFGRLQAEDMRNERRIFWSELGIIALVAFLVGVYIILL